MNEEISLPSINKLTQPLVEHLVENADALRVVVSKLENGCRIIDAGINCPGGLEAGRIIAEICMGGLGTVKLRALQIFLISRFLPSVRVKINTPPFSVFLRISIFFVR